ncbi:polysaccharide deacetylase family protein [Haliangium ochraceum]|uniref:polysaccharide deacetylase family protein n=1 Tax=Haliangium ochraceum TaxID=80816 RepID=UPI00019B9FE7|nr:polysaccharide deacetylase family protein [Haliangium ochraceum]
MLSVLCYHSVGEPDENYEFDPEVIDVTPAQFRAHLRVLRDHFSVIGVDALCEALRGGKLPPNPVIISFDDGYRSCSEVALPILQEFGFPATFFVATHYTAERRLYWWDKLYYLIKNSPRETLVLKYPQHKEIPLGDHAEAAKQLIAIVKSERGLNLGRFMEAIIEGTGITWSDEVEAGLADKLIMSWDDIRRMHEAGMDIQSHTRSHRVLQTLPMKDLVEELVGARHDIEQELHHRVRTVAYPVGYSISHLPDVRRAVQAAGYEIGFTNASGVNYLWRNSTIDPFDIRRLAIDRDLSMPMFRAQLALPPLGYASDHRGHPEVE